MNPARRQRSWKTATAIAGAMLSVLLGCVDRPGLVDPDLDGNGESRTVPRLRLGEGTDSMSLYAGGVVRLGVEEGTKAKFSVQLLLLDTARNVVWRSQPQSLANEERIQFMMPPIPDSVPRARRLLLSASIEAATGVRYYATDDSVAAKTLETAAVRSVFLFDGQAFDLGAWRIHGMAAAPELGGVLVTDSARGVVGSIELGTASPSLLLLATIGAGPTELVYRSQTLFALTVGGSEVAVLDASASAATLRQRVDLPAFFLRVTSPYGPPDTLGVVPTRTDDVPVRPYARGFSVACWVGLGDGCSEWGLLGSSRIVSEGETSGVMRAGRVGGTLVSPVVIPGFDAPFARYLKTEAWDTLPSVVRVLAGEITGSDPRELFRQTASRCLTLALGGGPVAASPIPGGPVFVAGAEAQPLCGQGTRVVRVDSAGSASPRMNLQAALNLMGEDRIGRISSLQVSPDGSRLLLLGQGVVYLLDDLLRLKSVVRLPGATSAVWVQDARTTHSLRFAVADPSGVSIYETERAEIVARAWVGGLEPGRVSASRLPDSSEYTIVGVLQGQKALVVARVPAR